MSCKKISLFVYLGQERGQGQSTDQDQNQRAEHQSLYYYKNIYGYMCIFII